MQQMVKEMQQECVLKETGLELPFIESKTLVVLIFAGGLFQRMGAATEKAN